ncbi:glycosyltransferase [Rhodocaloribacter litoris]|uniref:glycosyltransferase n=1 Tax=Rhodocaloribacter litoris TaxID=2558931 RepID=UPI001E611078|nr:glycosyltransferase [Rhodocaloribacter litoris]QXD16211.1 glycosyltransferase [Rhodocaloribacter litoris]
MRDPERIPPIEQLYVDYKRQLEQTGRSYEFIFVIEGRHPRVFDPLMRLKEQGEPVKILVFAKWYGEATALNAGFEQATGDVILTLPAYHQIDPAVIPSLVKGLGESDMVIVRRWPRVDSRLNRLQTRFFHFILRKLLGVTFQDLTCSVRVMKRAVIEEVHMYGDQQRFFPILAGSYGFKVVEVEAPQAEQDAFSRYFPAGVYIRRLLDLLSIFFLVKFTSKPLRFFGLSGLFVFLGGVLFSVVLVVQRLFLGEGLADRPALLFGVLLIVLGVLLFAIGLVGELIIFVHAKDLKEYRIEQIVN